MENSANGTGLRANSLGLIGLATFGAVMMSPALGLYGLFGPLASLVGKATPLVFLGALLVSLPTAVSYALVNREMPSAGSAFTWVWVSTSPALGTWVGLMMVVYYTVAVTLQPIPVWIVLQRPDRLPGIRPARLWELVAGSSSLHIPDRLHHLPGNRDIDSISGSIHSDRNRSGGGSFLYDLRSQGRLRRILAGAVPSRRGHRGPAGVLAGHGTGNSFLYGLRRDFDGGRGGPSAPSPAPSGNTPGDGWSGHLLGH